MVTYDSIRLNDRRYGMKPAIMVLFWIFIIAVGGNAQPGDPPGEVVGITAYPYQSSGMAGNRIARDTLGGVHITWTHKASPTSPRNVFYNFKSETGDWLIPGQGQIVNQGSGPGYSTLALTSENQAAITYHNIGSGYVMMAKDAFRGFGVFDYFDPPDQMPGGNRAFWPQIAISTNGDIHIIMAEHTQDVGVYPNMLYTRSTDGGASWTDPVVAADVALLGGCITVSPDGKVGIVYLEPVISGEFSQIKNDVCYFVSADGRSWDFANPTNITDYGNDQQEIYCPWGIDAVFGSDGNINVVWVAGHIADDGSFIDEVTGLWFYSQQAGFIDEIANSPDPLLDCTYGPVTLPISMPSISYSDYGFTEVFTVAYIGYDESDASAGGECLGDIYMVTGRDGGTWWLGPENVTDSHSPGCAAGDCLSENFISTNEVTGREFYTDMTYVMQNLGDDPDTVYYLTAALDIGDGIDEGSKRPRLFDLTGNYPNPFNARTTIGFELEAEADIELTVYDLAGAKVAVLADGYFNAGSHSVNWNAAEVSSGVYYCTLRKGRESLTQKMLLLK